jgi:hypothetical protein
MARLRIMEERCPAAILHEKPGVAIDIVTIAGVRSTGRDE